MSWSLNLRVVGVCAAWLFALQGCGGNPEVGSTNTGGTSDGPVGGETSTGGVSNLGGTKGGGPDIGPIGGTDGTGGSETPVPTFVCGNKDLEPGEFCDDGNTEDGDGCSADCLTVDSDFDCSAVGEPCVQVVICGNGVLEGDELCDDKNTEDDDGCAADCSMPEDGFVCIRPGEPCVEISVCGNGVRQRGEACDDGHPPASGDGCDDLCQIEPTYFCPIPGDFCVKQVCGDGVKTPGEQCDPVQQMPPVAGDGCDATCKVETGWHCNAAGCTPECGDGLVRGAEACDDNNAIGGDGCSSGCKVEPYFACTKPANAQSVCGPALTAADACLNNQLDPIFTGNVITGFEKCSPRNVDGCNATCTDFVPQTADPAVCGNNVVESGEACDRTGDPGCVGCVVQNGYTCPPVGACALTPKCNDNTVDISLGEECDPPKPGMGCTAACKVEAGWNCSGLGPSTCVRPMCGNGVVEPATATTAAEQCDDATPGNAVDGCAGCVLHPDYVCPAGGQKCLARCGDGKVVGDEQCDDGNTSATVDGCNAGCKIVPGYKCPTPGMACVLSVCGDGVTDKGEGCDDGGTCFGGNNAGTACTQASTCTGGGTCRKVAGDGCGVTCQKEPTVTKGTDPTVNVFCGDGVKLATEACDDGNILDGDGCQHDCTIQTPGWACNAQLTLPATLDMKITYRDFKSAAAQNGHPDFMYDNLGHVAGITGAVCTAGNTATCGRLNAQGKPALVIDNQATTGIRNAASFKMWYVDDPNGTGNPDNVNGFYGLISTAKLERTLTLTQTPVGTTTSEVYVYNSNGNNFYPINGAGLGNINLEGIGCGRDFADPNATDQYDGFKNYRDSVQNPNNTQPPDCFCTDANNNGTGGCYNKNYGFTSELRYFFQYKGGETLTFSGDDDVWVFVNGRLAVDIGGLHPQADGQVVLGDDGNGGGVDSNCSAHAQAAPDPNGGCYTTAERNDNQDTRFGLEKGKVYEIVLFHAERHVDASNFKLTLAGFLAPRSVCDTTCGDGIQAGDEFCDDGGANSNTGAGACRLDCTRRNFCGDKAIQSPEQCDDGSNITLYKTAQTPVGACAPGCKTPATCGDGVQQAGQGEQCDNGGNNNNNSYGDTSCKTNCTRGGYCGDGLPNGNEVCDLGLDNGKTYGTASCTYDCKPGPRCGDGVLAKGFEACDDGGNNGTAGSHCSTTCTVLPYCGDGIKQNNEQCDYGQFASTEYGGCTTVCMFGPRCGDGGPGNTPDPEEECDYGAAGNDGSYDGCTSKCGLGPRCGDGVLQANQGEVCDNGFNADDYNDPKTVQEECGMNCTAPPFCGDGVVQSAYELCDYGACENADDPHCNRAAGDAKGYQGCTTLCEFGPYCGDGEQQATEACDDGLDNVSYLPEMGGCGYDCQLAPYCGDGERNGPEQCDNGAENSEEYGKCKPDCTFGDRCGDRVKQGPEECDDGQTGSLTCTPTCKRRMQVQ